MCPYGDCSNLLLKNLILVFEIVFPQLELLFSSSLNLSFKLFHWWNCLLCIISLLKQVIPAYATLVYGFVVDFLHLFITGIVVDLLRLSMSYDL